MTRLVSVLALLFLFTTAPARPAEAGLGAILDYLESLSGPGPFWGITGSWALVCEPQAPVQDATGRTQGAGSVSGGCTGDMTKSRRVVSVFGGAYRTFENRPTDYVYANPEQKTYPVWAFPVAGAVDWSLVHGDIREDDRARQVAARTFDIGFTAGALVFKSFDRNDFGAFTTPYIELPRFTIRPFAYKSCQGKCSKEMTNADRFQIEVFLRYIGSVKATDFGALSGPVSGAHIQRGIRVGYSWQRQKKAKT